MNKTISLLIKPASSSCNLRCRYCFYFDETRHREIINHGIMSSDTTDVLINRIAENLNDEGTANISFQGGEPTVAGLKYFRYFTERLKEHKKIKTNYSIQTNGTLLNDEWAIFFKEHNFLVGVSLDGYKSNTDYFRKDINNDGVFIRIMEGIRLLEKHNCQYNILTVITDRLSRHPDELFDFYLKNNFKYIQLIPCLPSMDDSENNLSLKPEQYADFFNRFFDRWYKEAMKGNVLNVNTFENLASIIINHHPYQCGLIGQCIIQNVIESNGDVYPCDFYCLDEHKLGNIKDSTFTELNRNGRQFILDSSCKKKPCENCEFESMCHGGCKRQNACYLMDEYCAYRKVLKHCLPKINTLI
ncbi:MAG: radical SAM protein [Erysipelotrichaceae bacterium]